MQRMDRILAIVENIDTCYYFSRLYKIKGTVRLDH
jgi:hypothetical protein